MRNLRSLGIILGRRERLCSLLTSSGACPWRVYSVRHLDGNYLFENHGVDRHGSKSDKHVSLLILILTFDLWPRHSPLEK